LQKTVNAVEAGIKKPDGGFFTRTDAIAWAASFILGVLVCFIIVQQYTVVMVRDSFNKQIRELAEEPRKEAEQEAKRIIEQAQKKAKEIIQEAEPRGGK